MAQAPKPKPSAVPTPMAFDPFAALTEFQKAGLGPLTWMGPAWMETMTEIGREMTEFITERIQKDMATQQQIMNCKNFDELQAIQTNFIQCALEDYRAESDKLKEIGERFVAAATEQAKS